MNILAITLCVYDKLMAKMGKTRIKEFNLMSVSFLGGSLGMLISMYLVHHKTRKPKFKIGIPIFLSFQILIFILLNIYF